MLKHILACGALSTLVACGGGSGGGSPSPQPPTEDNGPYSVSGQVSGLSGSMLIQWDDQTLELTQNGGFTLDDAVARGDNLSLALSQMPEQQYCGFVGDERYTNVTADIRDVEIECRDLPRMSISVVNYFTGEPIENAEVAVNWQTAQTLNTLSGTTDDLGTVNVRGRLASDRLAVWANAEGYGEHTIIVSGDPGAAELSAQVLLLPITGEYTFDAASGARLALDGDWLLEVPSSAWVNADGELYAGEVSAELTLIDPSSDPGIMPGDYQSLNRDTATVELIESFGAVNFTFTGADGQPLDLADGTLADIRIPVASNVSDTPDVIPLYYFDEQLGYWIEEGEAEYVVDGGQAFYTGQVEHFTTWNADKVYETVAITGCVEDVEGNPVAKAQVRTRGGSYIGTSSTLSGDDGSFSVDARFNAQVYLSALSGGLSRTLTVRTSDDDRVLSECIVVTEESASITLSWDENPRDLDSHFSGPLDENGEQFFHIYFANSEVTAGSSEMYLDVDDTRSYGPEVITVPEFPFAGTYRYGVYHYSGSGNIASSPARVQLNLGGQERAFSPPGGEPGRCWAVMDLVVDTAGGVTVIPVNEWDSNYCTRWSASGAARPDAGGGVSSKPAQAVKHYTH